MTDVASRDEMVDPTDTTSKAPKTSHAPTHAAGTTGCGRCPQRWGGLRTAHCGACHATFTGLSAFDKHRDGDHAKGNRHCLPPESVGLVDAGRQYPCWGWPGGEDDRWGEGDE